MGEWRNERKLRKAKNQTSILSIAPTVFLAPASSTGQRAALTAHFPHHAYRSNVQIPDDSFIQPTTTAAAATTATATVTAAEIK